MSRNDLEDLIREDLTSKLDPQRGRARTTFDDRVVAPMRTRLDGPALASGRWKTRALVAVAMLACIIAGMGIMYLLNPAKPQTPDQPILPEQVAETPLTEQLIIPADYQHTTMTHYVDTGATRLANDAPARKVRIEQLDRYTWTDPKSGATFDYVTPAAKEMVLGAHRQ